MADSEPPVPSLLTTRISRRTILSMATAGAAAGFAGAIPGCARERGAIPPKTTRPKTLWASEKGSTIAIDAATGAKRWSRPFGVAVGPPIVIGGACYLPNADSICAVDAEDGTILWRQPIHSNIQGSSDLIYGSGLIFTATIGSKSETSVYALDRGTGKIRWRSTVDFKYEYMQYTSGWLALSSSDPGNLHFAILSAQSGKIYYQQPGIFLVTESSALSRLAGAAPVDGRFIVSRAPRPASSNTNGAIYCFDPQARKSIRYPDFSEIFAASQSNLFTGVWSDQPTGQSLQVNDIESGKLLWSMPQSGLGIIDVRFNGDIVLAITETGVTGISLSAGKALWSRHSWNSGVNKEVYSNDLAGGDLLLGSGPQDESPGGTISALDCRTGVIKWGSSIVVSPLDIVAAGDSLFAVAMGTAIYALDAKTGRHKWVLSIDDEETPKITVG